LKIIDKIKVILKSELFKTIVFFTVVSFFAAHFVLYFERQETNQQYQNLWDSVWWTIVTIFTVGYGDKAPVSIGGRLIAIFVMIAGLYLISLITATISSIFVTRKIREGQGLESIKYENHIIICGWNNTTDKIIDSIFLLSQEKLKIVLINELPEEQIHSVLDKYSKYKVKFVRGDYTRHNSLERANLSAAQAVLLLPNLFKLDGKAADDKTLLATLNIKSVYPKIKVLAFLVNTENEVHVKRAKADEIFVSDQYIDFLIASDLTTPGMKKIFSELFSEKVDKNSVRILQIPSRFKGKKYSEVFQYFKNQNNLLVGLLSERETLGVSDFLSSDTSHLDAFIEKKIKESGRSLGEDNKIFVNLNPRDDYIIGENEKAVVIS